MNRKKKMRWIFVVAISLLLLGTAIYLFANQSNPFHNFFSQGALDTNAQQFNALILNTPEQVAVLAEGCEVEIGTIKKFYDCYNRKISTTTYTTVAGPPLTCIVPSAILSNCPIGQTCAIDKGYSLSQKQYAYCKDIPKSTSGDIGGPGTTTDTSRGSGAGYQAPISSVAIPFSLSGQLDFSKVQPLDQGTIADPNTGLLRTLPGGTSYTTQVNGFTVISETGKNNAYESSEIGGMPVDMLVNGSCRIDSNFCPVGTSCVSKCDLINNGQLPKDKWDQVVEKMIALAPISSGIGCGVIAGIVGGAGTFGTGAVFGAIGGFTMCSLAMSSLISVYELDQQTPASCLGGICINKLPSEFEPDIPDSDKTPNLEFNRSDGGLKGYSVDELAKHICSVDRDCQKGGGCKSMQSLLNNEIIIQKQALDLSESQRGIFQEYGVKLTSCFAGAGLGVGITNKLQDGVKFTKISTPATQAQASNPITINIINRGKTSTQTLSSTLEEAALAESTKNSMFKKLTSNKVKLTAKGFSFLSNAITFGGMGLGCMSGWWGADHVLPVIDDKRNAYGLCIDKETAGRELAGGGSRPGDKPAPGENGPVLPGPLDDLYKYIAEKFNLDPSSLLNKAAYYGLWLVGIVLLIGIGIPLLWGLLRKGVGLR